MARADKNRSISGGFTIAELVIATAVFSVILMVAMTSFLQIGRMFYKGITISQTKETAQHVLDSVSVDLQYANSTPSSPLPTDPNSTYQYLCIGNSRYTYMPHHMIDSSKENWTDNTKPKDFGLLHDSLPGNNNPCGDPFASNTEAPLGGTNPAKNNSPTVEMLGNKMQLSSLAVGLTSPHNVSVHIAYGDNDLLIGNPDDPTCVSDLKSSEFCSVISLNTIVSKNFNF